MLEEYILLMRYEGHTTAERIWAIPGRELTYAKAALWDFSWTPGSVRYRVQSISTGKIVIDWRT